MSINADDLVPCIVTGILILFVVIWGGYEAYKAIVRRRIHLAKKNWPKLFAGIFRKAKKEVWILVAVTNRDIWENKEVVTACREAIQRRVTIHLACKWFDVRSTEMAQLINEGAVKFYPLPISREYNHFVLNDNGQFINFWERNFIARYIHFFHKDPGERKPDDFLSDFSREIKGVTPVASGTLLNHLKITDLKEKERLRAEYYLTDPSLVKTAIPKQTAEFISYLQN